MNILENLTISLRAPEPGDMARGIIEALENKQKAKEIVANAKELYKIKYARPIYETKMRKVLQLVT